MGAAEVLVLLLLMRMCSLVGGNHGGLLRAAARATGVGVVHDGWGSAGSGCRGLQMRRNG